MRKFLKLIVMAWLFAMAAAASAQTAVFNTANGQLTLPSVQLGSLLYTNVVIRLDTVNVLSVGSQGVVTITPGTQSTYAGRYRGAFSGGSAGSFDVGIDTAGNISGTGSVTGTGEVLPVSGRVGSTGSANFAAGGAGSASFTGSISTAGVFAGSWTGAGATGVFSGTRQ